MCSVQQRNLQFNLPLAHLNLIPIGISASTTVFWIDCRLNNAAACGSLPVCVQYWLNGCLRAQFPRFGVCHVLFSYIFFTQVLGPFYLINYLFLPLLGAGLLGWFCVPSLALLTILFVVIFLYCTWFVATKKAVFGCYELQPCVFSIWFLLF